MLVAPSLVLKEADDRRAHALACLTAAHTAVTDHEVQVTVAVKVRHDRAVRSIEVDAEAARHLLKAPRALLPVQQAAVGGVVRPPKVDVEPAVVVEIDQVARDDAFIPRALRFSARQAGLLVAWAIEPQRALAGVEQELRFV